MLSRASWSQGTSLWLMAHGRERHASITRWRCSASRAPCSIGRLAPNAS